MKTATKAKKPPVIVTPEEPPVGIKLEIIQSIADGLQKDISNLQVLIDDVAQTAGVSMPPRPDTAVPERKPYDDEHQPFTFGPAPMGVDNWITPRTRNDVLDRELCLQELDEFTTLKGGFRAIPCTKDPLDKGAGSIPGAVCFFSDIGPVAVNRGGLEPISQTKPLMIGGSRAATGMYVPFAACEDPEAVETTKAMIGVILDKDREMTIPEYMAMNGLL